jgi:hypothetical protein
MQGGLARRQGGSMVQSSPQRFPAQGEARQVTVAAFTHSPAPSHTVAAKVGHGLASPHGLQLAPHAFPAQGEGAGQVAPVAETHSPAASQAFTTAVSTQPESSGAHTVHAAPHVFPPQGS